MLDFNLQLSRDGNTFYAMDLFDDQTLEYSLDFYDALDIAKIKLPFYTQMKLPLTVTNTSVNRINFDPLTSPASDLPRDLFFFSLDVFGSAVHNITGMMTIKSMEYNSAEPYIEIELKDQLAYYLGNIKEVHMSELYNQADYTNSATLLEFVTYGINHAFFNGQEGTIGAQPSGSDAIIFPYVDMNNDTERYGYPQRNFLEYGTGINRSGLIPAFSVQRFLEYVGDYLSTANFPVRVDSKLFAVGTYDGTPYDSDFQPDRLRFVNDSHMLAKQHTNRRTFTLQQADAWSGTNASLGYLQGTGETVKYTYTGGKVEDKWFLTSYWGSMEVSGNSGGVGSKQFNQRTWGVKKQQPSEPIDNDDSVRGFFCPKVSYNSSLRLNGNPTFVNISGLELEIPVIEEDGLVSYVDLSNPSNLLQSNLCIGVYEDGMMVRKVILEDSLGAPLVLTATGTKAAYSNKNDKSVRTDYEDEDGKKLLIVDDSTQVVRDTLTYDSVDAYFPSDVELFVNGGSRYSVNYFLDPIGGAVSAKIATNFPTSGTAFFRVMTVESAATEFSYSKLKKLITRIPTLTEAAKLDVTLLANEDFLPHNASDEIVIQDSIAQTTEDTVYKVLMRISKRFNCGLFHEYDSVTSENVLRIDPLHVIRSGTQNIDELVDDLKSYKIEIGGNRVKTLTLENEKYDGFYDLPEGAELSTGSTVQDINDNGTEDLEVKFDSSIFFKSLCGEESFDRPATLLSGAFSENQLGIANNIYSMNKDIGFRFGYVKAPNYPTWILTPAIAYNENFGDPLLEGNMKTETERIYNTSNLGFGELEGENAIFVYNGELTHVNGQGWDLRAEDEAGDTTDYFDLYSAGETLLMAQGGIVEFDLVIPTSDLVTLDFFMQTLTAPSVTSNNMYVKSAEGEVFGEYAYLTIKALID